jgi:dihydroorotate dehydrogenase
LKLYESLLRPLLFRLPPETAHEFSLKSLSLALRPASVRKAVDRRLQLSPFGPLRRFGLDFSNPVGLAAGLDKNGHAASALAALGFGFIEIGTVTNHPQPGNPRPRLFRLPPDRALINRAGFNNEGATSVCRRLLADRPPCVLGVNIGKSRVVEVEDAVQDYVASFEKAHAVADYIVVNVSSPNTPNLRELQKPAALGLLLRSLQERNSSLSLENGRLIPIPLLVKLAPDIGEADLEEIVDTICDAGIDGIIATNTTVSREGLTTPADEVASIGAGGLSGNPLKQMATSMISELYLLTKGNIPIIGVGGIFSAEDAWEKICAGASLVQLYTGFIYEGPLIAHRINLGLQKLFENSGFNSLDEAIGSNVRKYRAPRRC